MKYPKFHSFIISAENEVGNDDVIPEIKNNILKSIAANKRKFHLHIVNGRQF